MWTWLPRCVLSQSFYARQCFCIFCMQVDAITLRGLKADCLPLSGVTDKLAGAIAKQKKAIAQSGVGFVFPAMAVADFLPSWALVLAFLGAVCERYAFVSV